MPKRSRNGRVISPERVVAPTSVKGGRSMPDRARARPLADDQVELKILHRRIEDLLDRRRQPMDLVDEQDVARLQVGQQGGEIAGALDHRTRGGAKPDPHFARHDLCERGLAEPGGPEQQHMIEGFAARLGGVDKDPQIVAQLALPDELGQDQRAQRSLGHIALALGRIDDAAGAVAQPAAPCCAPWASSWRPARISASVAAAGPSRCAAAATAPNASTRR